LAWSAIDGGAGRGDGGLPARVAEGSGDKLVAPANCKLGWTSWHQVDVRDAANCKLGWTSSKWHVRSQIFFLCLPTNYDLRVAGKQFPDWYKISQKAKIGF